MSEFDDIVQEQLRKRRAARVRWMAYGGILVLAGASYGGYVLMSKGKEESKPAAAAAVKPAAPPTEVAGRAQVVLPSLPAAVKVEAVAPSSAETKVEANAKVAPDETLTARVKPGVSGWIESLHAKGGARVAANQPVMTIFSRQLVTAEQDYLDAFNRLVGAGRTPSKAVLPAITTERNKLVALGMTPGEITVLERTGMPMSTLTLKAPRAGVLKLRGATVAAPVEPANEVFTVGETTSLWVVALVPANEARALKPGLAGRVTFPGLASLDTTTPITGVGPTPNEPRWTTVRFTVPNKTKALRVGVDAKVEVTVPPRSMLLLPRSAVISDWATHHVFVESGGALVPRKVVVGAKVGDRLEIVEGLKEGERVVVAGADLIDKQSIDAATPKPVAAKK